MDENKNQHLKKVQGTEHRLSIRGPGRPRGFCPSSFFWGGEWHMPFSKYLVDYKSLSKYL